MDTGFEAQHDIAAPAEYVFECAQDFARFEALARARGVAVERHGSAPKDGLAWTVRFDFRAMRRKVKVTLTEHEPPGHMRFAFRGRSVEGRSGVRITPLADGQSRLSFDVVIAPRTLAARLILQSLSLSRGRIERKLAARVQGFARTVEARWAGQSPPDSVTAAEDRQDRPRVHRGMR